MIKVRKANRSDIDSIVFIEKKCFPKNEAASRNAIEERMKVFQNHFFVAQLGDEVIGFVNGCVSNEGRIRDEMYEDTTLHCEDGKYQMIFGLDVLEGYRRKGIAHKLMDTIIQSAREEGREGVILTCKKELIPFYELMGFWNRGVSESKHGGVIWFDLELHFYGNSRG
ncbi:MAG TPA: GNAT family N-acetyltransferase [Lachnospiraceae bacterium]|nr:GNAT family N-acetyltransferase [Lachnospiraceae bacterium]